MVLAQTLPAERLEKQRIRGLPDRRYDETNWWRVRCVAKELVDQWIELVYARWYGQANASAESWDPDRYEASLSPP